MTRTWTLGVLALLVGPSLAAIVHCGSGASRDAFDERGESLPTSPASPPSETGSFGSPSGEAGAAPQTCAQDVDVVLALDVSSTMDFVLDKLDAEIDKVVKASNALKAGAHFGLVLFVDNVHLDTTGDLEGGRVHSGASSLKAAFRSAKSTYTTPNRNPGDGPQGPKSQNPLCEENALDALHDSATAFPWRENAARVVIVATDDTFLERPDNYGDRDGDGRTDKTNYPREGNYPARFTVDETVAELQKRGIRVFSFTRLKPPGSSDSSRCGTDRRHTSSASITEGWSKPYGRHAPLPDATGGKNFELEAVESGAVSLAETINSVVLSSYCNVVK